MSSLHVLTGDGKIPFDWLISLNGIDGVFRTEKFGLLISNSGSYPEDIWSAGGVYTYPSVPAVNYISSSNGTDTEIITVIGLDHNWKYQKTTITLNGQNKTVIPGVWIRIFIAYNSNGAPLVGDIYIYEDDTITNGVPDTSSKIRAKINIGKAKTLMSHISVPVHYYALLLDLQLTLSSGNSAIAKSIDVGLFVREDADICPIFINEWNGTMVTTGSSTVNKSFKPPRKYKPKSDLRFQATNGSVAGLQISSSMAFVFVHEDVIPTKIFDPLS